MNIIKPSRHQSGFTLLEMVVSLAIVAIVSTVLSQVFIATLRTNTKTEILKDVKQTGEIALETMVRQIQNAKSVTTSCDYAGITSQSITLVNADNGETTLGCVLDGTTTRLASISAQGTQYLTTPNVTMGGSTCSTSTLEFLCKGGAGVSSSVTISFQLAQSGVAVGVFEQSSESFQTSASMRNIAQ